MTDNPFLAESEIHELQDNESLADISGTISPRVGSADTQTSIHKNSNIDNVKIQNFFSSTPSSQNDGIPSVLTSSMNSLTKINQLSNSGSSLYSSDNKPVPPQKNTSLLRSNSTYSKRSKSPSSPSIPFIKHDVSDSNIPSRILQASLNMNSSATDTTSSELDSSNPFASSSLSRTSVTSVSSLPRSTKMVLTLPDTSEIPTIDLIHTNSVLGTSGASLSFNNNNIATVKNTEIIPLNNVTNALNTDPFNNPKDWIKFNNEKDLETPKITNLNFSKFKSTPDLENPFSDVNDTHHKYTKSKSVEELHITRNPAICDNTANAPSLKVSNKEPNVMGELSDPFVDRQTRKSETALDMSVGLRKKNITLDEFDLTDDLSKTDKLISKPMPLGPRDFIGNNSTGSNFVEDPFADPNEPKRQYQILRKPVQKTNNTSRKNGFIKVDTNVDNSYKSNDVEADIVISPFDDSNQSADIKAPPLPTRPTREEIILAHSPSSLATYHQPQPVSPALPPRPVTPRIMGARVLNPLEGNASYPSSPAASAIPDGSSFQVQDERYQYLRNKETFYRPDFTNANRKPPTASSIGCTDPVIKGSSNAKVATASYGLVATGLYHIRTYNVTTGEMLYSMPVGELKVSSMGFPPAQSVDNTGKILWVGLQGGEIIEYDAYVGQVLCRKTTHQSSVLYMISTGSKFVTLDDQGGVRIWHGPVRLDNRPKSLRVLGRPYSATMTNDTLWCACGKIIEIYYYPDDNGTAGTNADAGNLGFQQRHDLGSTVGNVTVLTSSPDNTLVFSGHEDGKVTIWNAETLQRVRIFSTGMYKITSMLAVSSTDLWIGFFTGKIQVIRSNDLSEPNSECIVVKDFHAYLSGSVETLVVDFDSTLFVDRVVVCSLGDSGIVRLWDGLLTCDYLESSIHAQRQLYCNFQKIKLLICSWNCNATKPSELENGSSDDVRFLKSWLTVAGTPDMIVIGMQELVNLESKTVNAKEILKTKKKNQQVDHRVKVWRETLTSTIRQTHPEEAYFVAHISQMMGLFQCILVREKLRRHVRNISTHTVKTGMGGYHGNKGGIATRLIIQDSSFCFINAHLAAHQNQVSARNHDAATILKDATFPLIARNEESFIHGGDGKLVIDHEHIFFSGDLNYRIDMDRQRAIDLIYSNQWDLLHKSDQLLKQMDNLSFPLHNFCEGELNFPPTFKYDIGSDEYDTSEKRRIPSWCDRILYKGDIILKEYSRSAPWPLLSDHRPIHGIYEVNIKRIDPGKHAKLASQARDMLHRHAFKQALMLRIAMVAKRNRISIKEAECLLEKTQGDVRLAIA